MLVDTQGNLLKAIRPMSTIAEPFLDEAAQAFPLIRHLWADIAYQGLKAWLPATLAWTLTVTKHWWTGKSGFWVAPGQQPPKIPTGFRLLPKRWMVTARTMLQE